QPADRETQLYPAGTVDRRATLPGVPHREAQRMRHSFASAAATDKMGDNRHQLSALHTRTGHQTWYRVSRSLPSIQLRSTLEALVRIVRVDHSVGSSSSSPPRLS